MNKEKVKKNLDKITTALEVAVKILKIFLKKQENTMRNREEADYYYELHRWSSKSNVIHGFWR